MIMNKPSVFASEEWLTVPFEDEPKEPIDHIIGILTLMPENLSNPDTLLRIVDELIALWPHLRELIPNLKPSDSWSSLPHSTSSHLLRMCGCTPQPCLYYPGPVSATSVAFYNLA